MFYDADSGLYLTKYRAYYPAIGRWLSRDLVGEGTNRVGNLYPYVGGNSVVYVDPGGEFFAKTLLVRLADSAGGVSGNLLSRGLTAAITGSSGPIDVSRGIAADIAGAVVGAFNPVSGAAGLETAILNSDSGGILQGLILPALSHAAQGQDSNPETRSEGGPRIVLHRNNASDSAPTAAGPH